MNQNEGDELRMQITLIIEYHTLSRLKLVWSTVKHGGVRCMAGLLQGKHSL